MALQYVIPMHQHHSKRRSTIHYKMKNKIIDKENLNKPSLMLTLKFYMHMTIYLVHNRLLYLFLVEFLFIRK